MYYRFTILLWWFILFVAWTTSGNTYAVTFHVGSAGGFMTQPTSNYYHAIYGAHLDLVTEERGLLLRALYVERPKFRAMGFEDQDYAGLAFIGTKVTNAKSHGLMVGIGYGFVGGYIKLDSNSNYQIDAEKRSYRITGPAASLEYEFQWSHFDFAFGHQTFVGFAKGQRTFVGLGEDEEVNTYVAWPYNFLLFRIGYYW